MAPKCDQWVCKGLVAQVVEKGMGLGRPRRMDCPKSDARVDPIRLACNGGANDGLALHLNMGL